MKKNDESAEARHEAGHAVAAIVCGYAVTSIDIIPQIVPGTGGQMGKAGADLQLPTLQAVTGQGEEAVISILVVLFSGYLAERDVNPFAQLEDHHEHSDGFRAKKFAAFAIAPPVIQNGQLVTKVDSDQFRALWYRAEDRAKALVQEYAASIDDLASLLEREGKLSRAQIESCLRPLLP